ncbi:hypothetical protein ACJX0J_012783, partial [Zea mays]
EKCMYCIIFLITDAGMLAIAWLISFDEEEEEEGSHANDLVFFHFCKRLKKMDERAGSFAPFLFAHHHIHHHILCLLHPTACMLDIFDSALISTSQLIIAALVDVIIFGQCRPWVLLSKFSLTPINYSLLVLPQCLRYKLNFRPWVMGTNA